MASINIWVILALSGCLWKSSIAGSRSVRIPTDLTDGVNIINEDDLYQRIEFKAEALGSDGTTVAPVDYGDLEIAFVLEQGSTTLGDVEPGFDFTPDLGPLPVTFTVTIKEGEMESNLFVLQILDDCHREFTAEPLRIRPAGTIAYTNVGTSYDVVQSDALYELHENVLDTGNIIIHMDQEYPSVGFLFFEGETGAKIPVKGLECSDSREVPIDDTCETDLTITGDTVGYNIDDPITISEDATDIPVDIVDDSDFAPPLRATLQFEAPVCGTTPNQTRHSLNTDPVTLTIVDNDEEVSYGIVYPAAIGRKESRDVNVYAVTSQVDIQTSITRNDAVCPYTTKLPLCKSTELMCPSNETYGQCTTFPKPKRQSRDRFGSYVISAEYNPVQEVPVFIRPLGDAVTPLRGPTITINDREDVVIGVKFSDYVRELRWYFNGKELKKYRGKCNFEIKEARYGVHDGYYEVNRVQRRDSGYRSIIRLIIRRCGENSYFDGTTCQSVEEDQVCLNGGVLENTMATCKCPPGFYGQRCELVDPSNNFRVGPLGKGLNCRDVSKDIPRDCKGALFCFVDPLGCLCARGYWGPKCDRVCPHGRFGWSCRQHCNCVGPWDSCDPKTGLCKSGACETGYTGPNCQQLQPTRGR